MTNKRYQSYSRMQLNSFISTDEGFSKRIKFIVEEYIENDIPYWHEYDNLKDALLKAYLLKLDDKLHCITVMDSKKNCMSSDALNYWNDVDYIEIKKQNERLKNEIEEYRQFMKDHEHVKIDKLYKDWKESRK